MIFFNLEAGEYSGQPVIKITMIERCDLRPWRWPRSGWLFYDRTGWLWVVVTFNMPTMPEARAACEYLTAGQQACIDGKTV